MNDTNRSQIGADAGIGVHSVGEDKSEGRGGKSNGLGPTSRALHEASDPLYLSDLSCFLRRHVEAFVVLEPDGEGKGKGRVRRQPPGRVGLRCIHCSRQGRATSKDNGGSSGGFTSSRPDATSVSFPSSIKLVYQTMRNMQRYHIQFCPSMPADARAEFEALREGKGKVTRSSRNAPLYWEACCRSMGMVDVPHEASGRQMIRLRNGRFEDGCESDDLTAGSEGDDTSGQMALFFRSLVAAGRAEGSVNEISAGAHRSSEPVEAVNHSDHLTSSNAAAGYGTDLGHLNGTQDTAGTFTSSFPLAPRQQQVLAPTSTPHDVLQMSPASEHHGFNHQHTTADLLRIHKSEALHSLSSDQGSAGTSDSIRSISLLSNSHRPMSVPLSNEAVLERLQLALSAVLAIKQLDQDSFPSTTNKPSGNDNVPRRECQSEHEDISFLGAELYEMFAGQSPYTYNEPGLDNDSSYNNGSGGCSYSRADDDNRCATPCRQRSKKEKRLDDANGYVPLSELGLPAALCTLVSSLLDVDPSGNINGSNGSLCQDKDLDCMYESISDVEEDLRLMISEPEKFLFRHGAAAVHTGTPSLHFNPSSCYGREAEIEKIIQALDRTTDTNSSATAETMANRPREMVLISGASGTGKSCLVQNVSCHFKSRGARFVSGKFDAMLQLQPLSAIVSSVDEYCAVLANDDERKVEVRTAVTSAIGSEGRAVLGGLLPNIVRLLGPAEDHDNTAPPVANVNGMEALRRLTFMIRTLFRVTCSCSHPVVMFLDDLQWADETSLLLMNALATDMTIEGFLFIGCYRNDEVGADHPLRMRISDIECMGFANITSLCVDNLDTGSVESMLSDALCLSPRMVRHLAKAVWLKTAGNALFVVQFVSSLHDEGLIRFSLLSRRWEWDIKQIQKKEISSSVVKLMMAKILKMAPEVHEALKIASCFGAECEEDIYKILDRAPDRIGDTAAALDIAVSEGIMNKVDSVYRFAHDTLHEAAYELVASQLVPESENKAALHLLIGRLLWKWASDDEVDTFLFVLVDQLHRGSSLLTDPDEKVKLARLSLLAGEKAHALSAFLPASSYLNAGCSMLTETDWVCRRKMCFRLLELCAETQYIVGDFASMKLSVKSILSKAEKLSEKLRAYHILVLAFGAQSRFRDAINTSLSLLDQLGEDLSMNMTEETAKKEIRKTMQLLSTQTDVSLLEMKAMIDPEKLEVMKFLHTLLLYASIEGRPYFPVAVCRMVQLSLRYGLCKESAFGFACFAIILCGPMCMFKLGYRYGKLALSIIERFQANEYAAKVYGTVYGCINNATEPIQSLLPPLMKAMELGLTVGDTEYAMQCAHKCETIGFASGKALPLLIEEMKMHSKQMLGCKQNSIDILSKPVRQAALNLLGKSADPIKLVGEEMTEHDYLDSGGSSALLLFFVSSHRMWLEYMFGEYQLAWETAGNNKEIGEPKSARAIFGVGCHNCLFLCLTAIALAREECESKYTATIKSMFSQMEVWAEASHWNFQNKLELMKAEYAYLKNDFVMAEKCYQISIDLAIKHHFVHEQAIALERAGLFYLQNGENNRATEHFVLAHDCYCQWGAEAKASHIQLQYIR